MKNATVDFLMTILFGGSLTGTIGFAAGFFGPVIFWPHQYPVNLTGLLFTGIAGFAMGFFTGFFYQAYRIFRQDRLKP